MKPIQYRLIQSTKPSIRKYLAILPILIAQLMLPTPSFSASQVFFDDFEGGISSAWAKDDFRDMCPSVGKANDGGSPKSGSGMLSCNWNGEVAWNDRKSYQTLKLPNWSYNKEFLIRAWIRTDADGDTPKDGPKIFRIGADGRSEAEVDFNGGAMTAFFFNSNQQIGGTFWGAGSSLGDGNWHKFELYIKEGASGVIRIWEDGAMKYEYLGSVTQTTGGWGEFWISSNWSGGAPGDRYHDASNHIYWDNFEIYSDIGVGAVGSLSDASISVSGLAPPNPPIIK